MSNQVEAIVTFNDGIAYVLSQPVEFTYYKQGDLIIGLDDTCTFVSCYFYERPSMGFKAFGGREFDITLENGEVIHCDGQWWDGGYQKAEKLLGEELVRVTYEDIESLKKCYVFSGCKAIASSLSKLRETYDGEVQGYWAYEALLKGRDKPIREDRKQ
ncbi:hypothetical protein [Paenibacillus sp. FSL R7-0331]|uniref:hypothetical protein n=1 Tax=Paenibacillus sp. FSL R7-0331 TaxID=1536773 RepID=UPI0004F8F465|nr:hypothetical protein [Paenibacillus sp. FSL R7-0331]AIQ54535.1 hypothetical protein R70331_25460 [Paenibacillus sp. FSL R7-0331]